MQACPRCGTRQTADTAPAGLCATCLLASALLDDADIGQAEPFVAGSELASGSMLGSFRIISLLGAGGMASVYEAYDTPLDRIVALKVLPRGLVHDDTFARRFQQEARLAASLAHPHIVTVYASGVGDGVGWISMRLLTGGSVGALLQHGRISANQAVAILRDVADAVDYAHGAGVIHRDIKPTNIFLDDAGRACLGDFGLAQMMERSAGLTRVGTIAGTPQYMSPEQAQGGTVDQRTDIYALGLVAYEMLAGRVPFSADAPLAVLLKQVSEPLPVPASADVSAPVFAVLEQALAKDPRARWPSAGAFVAALEKAVQGDIDPVAAGRGRRYRGAGVLLALALSLTVILLFSSGRLGLGPAAPQPGDMQIAGRPFGASAAPMSPTATGQAAAVLRRGGTVAAPQDTPRSARARAARSASVPQPDGAASITASPANDSEPTVPSPERPAAPAPERVPAAIPEGRSLVSTAAAVPVNPVPNSPPGVEAQVSDVVAAPVRIRTVPPVYPPLARAAEIQGEVLLTALVGADGRVSAVDIVRATHPLLDEAARTAVRQYLYTPGSRNGIPEARRVQVTVTFKLQ